MALARLQVNSGKKGKALPHAEYITRTGKYADRLLTEKLEHTASGNMPKWAEHDPMKLWGGADEFERANGSTYREHEIALPRELDEQQRLALVQDWIKSEVGNLPYTYAIHNKIGMDGNEQPHVHLMFCERLDDGIERTEKQFFKRYNKKEPHKGGRKKDNTGKKPSERKEELKQLRYRWEVTCNHHLERAGTSERINMRTLKEQGITDREPIDIHRKALLDKDVRQAYIDGLKGNPKQIINNIEQNNKLFEEVYIKRIEQLERETAKKAVHTRPKQQKPLKTAKNAPKTDNTDKKEDAKNQDGVKTAQMIINKTDVLVRKTATEIYQDTKQSLVNKRIRLVKEYKEVEKNKPILIGRKDWQNKLDNLRYQHSQATQSLEQIKRAEKFGYAHTLYEEQAKQLVFDSNAGLEKLYEQANQVVDTQNRIDSANKARERQNKTSEKLQEKDR